MTTWTSAPDWRPAGQPFDIHVGVANYSLPTISRAFTVYGWIGSRPYGVDNDNFSPNLHEIPAHLTHTRLQRGEATGFPMRAVVVARAEAHADVVGLAEKQLHTAIAAFEADPHAEIRRLIDNADIYGPDDPTELRLHIDNLVGTLREQKKLP